MTSAPTTGEAAVQKMLCSICNDPLAGSDWVACAQCEVPIHRRCWEYSRACPVYACGSTVAKEPLEFLLKKNAVVIRDAAPPVPVRPQEVQAQTYLRLDARRSQLTAQLEDLLRKRKTARWFVPGLAWMPWFLLMMFLAPGWWSVWCGIFAFGFCQGILKKLRLKMDEPADRQVEEIRERIEEVEHLLERLLPPGEVEQAEVP